MDLITQKHLPPQDLLHQEIFPVASANCNHSCHNNKTTSTTTPTNAKLLAIIAILQAQVSALQNAAPAVAAAPPAGAAPVVFADMPQMLSTNDLMDYSMKRGSAIFEQGCKALDDKALTNGFAMTPDQTVIFVKAFHHRATVMGWNQGTR